MQQWLQHRFVPKRLAPHRDVPISPASGIDALRSDHAGRDSQEGPDSAKPDRLAHSWHLPYSVGQVPITALN